MKNFLAQMPFVKNRAKNGSKKANGSPSYMIAEVGDVKKAVEAKLYYLQKYLQETGVQIETFEQVEAVHDYFLQCRNLPVHKLQRATTETF